VALSWDAVRAVPYVIGVGVAHVIVGVAWVTSSVTDADAEVKSVVSVGVNVTLSVFEPEERIPVEGV
jgi:hypothetical protein